MKEKMIVALSAILVIASAGGCSDSPKGAFMNPNTKSESTAASENIHAKAESIIKKAQKPKKIPENAAKENTASTGNSNPDAQSGSSQSPVSEKEINNSTDKNMMPHQKEDTSSEKSADKSKVQDTNKPGEHTHNWIEHKATGHHGTVVLREAYDEEVLVSDSVTYDIVDEAIVACNICGDNISRDENHDLYDCGGFHSEGYMSGYCCYCRTPVEFRQCSWRGYIPKCSTYEPYEKIVTDEPNHTVFMYYQSCDCGKNEILVSGETGKGLFYTTEIVHHEPDIQISWIEDSKAYRECSICGKKEEIENSYY